VACRRCHRLILILHSLVAVLLFPVQNGMHFPSLVEMEYSSPTVQYLHILADLSLWTVNIVLRLDSFRTLVDTMLLLGLLNTVVADIMLLLGLLHTVVADIMLLLGLLHTVVADIMLLLDLLHHSAVMEEAPVLLNSLEPIRALLCHLSSRTSITLIRMEVAVGGKS